MSNKHVGFDLTKVEDDYGAFDIVSIDGNSFPVSFGDAPMIVNWPNSGTIVEASLPGEDGDIWLRQTIVDYENVPPMPSNQIVMVIRTVGTEIEHNVDSCDFIGGRPPHRPTT